ncbi:hypothetical protein ACEWY4_009311 [Coilia grayii]|uniref:Uncharacterized protein n=1 Tax=Coilia grayii TaxID=363190 RepID=A0ABD1K641_9TELE
MATLNKHTAQGNGDVYPPKSKSTRNKNSPVKQRPNLDNNDRFTSDQKKRKKKKKKEKTSDSEKKQANKSSSETHKGDDSSSTPNSGDTAKQQPEPESCNSNTSPQKHGGGQTKGKTSKCSKKLKNSVSNQDTALGSTVEKAKEEVRLESLESLRWEGVLDDPEAEARRLEVYKANRRKRYLAARQLQLGKTDPA